VHKVLMEECLTPLTPGTKIPSPTILFQKISDETVEHMSKILSERVKKAEST